MAPIVNRSPDTTIRLTNNLTSDLNLLSSLYVNMFQLNFKCDSTFYLKGASWTPLGTVETIPVFSIVVVALFCIFCWL